MERFLIVGLGNIGAEYARTRHNMGFMILDAFADASNIVFETQRYGDIAKTSFKGREIVLLKPSTFMNLSGNAVRYWMDKLNVPVERLLIICDDLNLPFGTLRMRKKGSDGGHNGLKNIQELINTQNYTRIRAGIGNDFNKGGQIDFVIGKFNTDEEDKIPSICEKAAEGIKSFITIGPERTMSSFNTKNAE